MQDSTTSAAYMWAAPPAPVSRYGGDSSSSSQVEGIGNIMYDRRVFRGSTYKPYSTVKRGFVSSNAPSARARSTRRPAQTQEQREYYEAQQAVAAARQNVSSATARSSRGGGGVGSRGTSASAAPVSLTPHDLQRALTPEPLPGRHHLGVQTVNYLEDFRKQKTSKDVGTQTNPEMDLPTKALFEPRSSGVDVYTLIEGGQLFDFDLEVEPVLEVLASRCLDQSLMEVLEEEETKELAAQKRAFGQQRNVELAELQRLQAREDRLQAAKVAFEKHAVELAAEAENEEALAQARAVAKQFLGDLGGSVLNKLDDSGFFSDPVKEEIQRKFVPWLQKRVDQGVISAVNGRALFESALEDALHKPLSQPTADVEEVVDGEVKEEEVAAFADSLVANAIAQAAPQGSAGEQQLTPSFGFTASETQLETGGVAVASLLRFGAATHASIVLGDVILAINGKAVSSRAEVEVLERGCTPGEMVEFQVFRGVRQVTEDLMVEVFGAVDSTNLAPQEQVRSAFVQGGRIAPSWGQLYDQDSALQELRNLIVDVGFVAADAEAGDGILITSASANSAGSRAGLEVGDYVLSVNGVNINNVSDLEAFKNDLLPGDIVEMLFAVDALGRGQNRLLLEVGARGTSVERVRALRFMADLPVMDTVKQTSLRTDKLRNLDQALHEGQAVEEKTAAEMKLAAEETLQEEAGVLPAPEAVADDEEERAEALTSLKLGTPDYGMEFEDIPGEDGVRATEVEFFGGAAHAFLVQGDIIREIDGVPVKSVEHAISIRDEHLVGDRLMLTVERGLDGRTEMVEIELHSAGRGTEGQRMVRHLRERAGLDFTLDQLHTPETAQRLWVSWKPRIGLRIIDGPGDGVEVTDVLDNGPAGRAGIVDGDILLTFNGVRVDDNDHLIAAAQRTHAGDMIKIERVTPGDSPNDILDLEVGARGGISVEQVRAIRQMIAPAAQLERQLELMDPSLGIDVDGFLEVLCVKPFGACSQACVVTGDHIVSVNGTIVNSVQQLVMLEDSMLPGDVIDLELIRNFDGRKEVVQVELHAVGVPQSRVRQLREEIVQAGEGGGGLIDEQKHIQLPELLDEKSAHEAFLQLRPRVGLKIVDGPGDGVEVTDVVGGPAGRAGLQDGDFILSIDGVAVNDNDAFKAVISKNKPGDVVVFERRAGKAGPIDHVDCELGATGRVSQERVRTLREMAGIVNDTFKWNRLDSEFAQE